MALLISICYRQGPVTLELDSRKFIYVDKVDKSTSSSNSNNNKKEKKDDVKGKEQKIQSEIIELYL